MKGYAMLGIGKTGWIEKERPLCGPLDAIVRPIAVSPCTSDVHTVWEGAIGDRHNMVYSGCSITYGRATAVVTATAMNTEMGKIAGLLDASEDGQTPLQQKLANMGKYLGIVALALSVLGIICVVCALGSLAAMGAAA